MKLKKLIEALEDYMDDDMEVVVETQPDRHPLYFSIREVTEEDGVVVIVEGSRNGYTPSQVAGRGAS